jgi:hypothetical protein
VNNSSNSTIITNSTLSGTQELVFNEQDLQQLGITINGTECQTEEYETSEYSPLMQYSVCNYNINNLNDSQVIVELKKFTNFESLNGTYQYDSLHLYSVEGLISENDYGDQSRFRVNNVNDYGGNINNEPNVYYYHLWICKDTYLIHITSKGSKETKEYVAKMGRQILSKFG